MRRIRKTRRRFRKGREIELAHVKKVQDTKSVTRKKLFVHRLISSLMQLG